jgi:acetyl-CoA carboxylase biotin carboxylase subunit
VFAKLLIANRGEIAVRIARTCRELGIRTVAVYSTPDADSAAVRMCDEAVHIGPAEGARSYLSMPALIESCRVTGADALHPGYGFLSEDPDFAEVCAANGVTFVGPPPAAMELLGDKASTRGLALREGLPLLPGDTGVCTSPAAARRIADEIGYPVIIKAVAGGGGKGMTVVHKRAELDTAFRSTRATAQAVFSDNRVYLERYLEAARHVEVQVLLDQYGNGLHLGDRDCSVQRRNQKLIEEAPAPGLAPAVRAAMARTALAAVSAAGLTGAATVEFLVDSADSQQHFYLMEINARLQVEHGVTEMVTGIDLVEWQLRIAAGEPLTLAQDDIRLSGSAIECRINAEDPGRDFRPTPGELTEVRLPGGPFVRVDTYVHPGSVVTPYYDSMVAKIMAWAPERSRAIARSRRALAETVVSGPGVVTTTGVLADVLRTDRFGRGEYRLDLLAEVVAARYEAATPAPRAAGAGR